MHAYATMGVDKNSRRLGMVAKISTTSAAALPISAMASGLMLATVSHDCSTNGKFGRSSPTYEQLPSMRVTRACTIAYPVVARVQRGLSRAAKHLLLLDRLDLLGAREQAARRNAALTVCQLI